MGPEARRRWTPRCRPSGAGARRRSRCRRRIMMTPRPSPSRRSLPSSPRPADVAGRVLQAVALPGVHQGHGPNVAASEVAVEPITRRRRTDDVGWRGRPSMRQGEPRHDTSLRRLGDSAAFLRGSIGARRAVRPIANPDERRKATACSTRPATSCRSGTRWKRSSTR